MNLIEYFQDQSDILNENKYFIGLMMIMVNIGARFIIDELNDEHRKIFKNSYFRRAVIFAVIFMATRDIMIAFVVTGIFILLVLAAAINSWAISFASSGSKSNGKSIFLPSI